MYPNNRRVVATLASANAPRVFWADAYKHQVNVVGNLTKSKLGDAATPYEMWKYTKKTDQAEFFTGLRMLFYLCFLHFSHETQYKLGGRFEAGIYLGYADDFKAHRVLIIRTGKIVAAAEASFKEAMMPFHYPEVWKALGFSRCRASDEALEFDDMTADYLEDKEFGTLSATCLQKISRCQLTASLLISLAVRPMMKRPPSTNATSTLPGRHLSPRRRRR
jgi:hypothetical protein